MVYLSILAPIGDCPGLFCTLAQLMVMGQL